MTLYKVITLQIKYEIVIAMNNVSMKKNLIHRNIQSHVEPPYITLVNNGVGANNYYSGCIRVNNFINSASYASNNYLYKLELFENVEPEEFLPFVRGYWNTLEATGKMPFIGQFQYLRTLIRVESLHHFETLFNWLVPLLMKI